MTSPKEFGAILDKDNSTNFKTMDESKEVRGRSDDGFNKIS